MSMQLNWWVVDALEKVFPESVKPSHSSEHIELWAAGNETEDVQVAISVPPTTKINKASFAFSPLTGPRNHTLGVECCRAFWEWYIYVLANPLENTDPTTYLRKAPAFFPDAFLEEKEIPLRSGITQPVWISIQVPTDTPAGTYQGNISFSFEGGADRKRINVPIVLHVWPFCLPEKPSLHHTEWFFPDLLANYYHLDIWSEDFWSWIERVAVDMAKHKQDMILTDFTKLVSVVQHNDGGLTFDFNKLDRWLTIFQKAGVEWIEGGHIAGGGGGVSPDIRFLRWSPLDVSGKPIDTSAGRMQESEFERYTKHLLKAVYAHLHGKGLAARYVQHIADEPNDATQQKSWRRISRKVKTWLPDVPRIDAMPATGMEGDIEIRVPLISNIHKLAHGKLPEQLWSYVCLAPQTIYPNRFLDYRSIRNRIIYWLSWSLRLKGFLHWGYNYWSVWGCPIKFPINPWTDSTAGGIYHSYPLPAGDPHIVYPGKTSICSSIRWETIRKGFEDFEYLKMLDTAVTRLRKKSSPQIAKGEKLLSFVKTDIANNPAHYTQDHMLLQSVRRQMGESLARLV